MDLSLFQRRSEHAWEVAPHGPMRVPAVIFGSEALLRDMDAKVYEQAVNVASLPGIVEACYAMPDAHWGYGFPIGGVAAFDPTRAGWYRPAVSGSTSPAVCAACTLELTGRM